MRKSPLGHVVDGHVIDVDTTLDQQLVHVTVGKSEAQVPPHRRYSARLSCLKHGHHSPSDLGFLISTVHARLAGLTLILATPKRRDGEPGHRLVQQGGCRPVANLGIT